jgi:hypothetical protein
MIRALLSLGLCALCLGVGLYTANLQAENYARAAELDAKKRRCDLLEASNERAQFEINARLRGVERELYGARATVESSVEDVQ